VPDKSFCLAVMDFWWLLKKVRSIIDTCFVLGFSSSLVSTKGCWQLKRTFRINYIKATQIVQRSHCLI
jgi:hypothetical protein